MDEQEFYVISGNVVQGPFEDMEEALLEAADMEEPDEDEPFFLHQEVRVLKTVKVGTRQKSVIWEGEK